MNNVKYRLLPFTFTRILDKELLVNEVGDVIISPNGTVNKLCNKEPIEENLYKSLVANYFITEQL